ncbi:hypothetical protein D3C83_49540 [compost metagenome]
MQDTRAGDAFQIGGDRRGDLPGIVAEGPSADEAVRGEGDVSDRREIDVATVGGEPLRPQPRQGTDLRGRQRAHRRRVRGGVVANTADDAAFLVEGDQR